MGITLTRKETRFSHRNNCRRAWSMEVTAESDLPELDANIFVYHAVEPEDPEAADSFSNVASLQDMNIIPVDAPSSVLASPRRENFIPYYRKARVVLDFYNASDMERAWKIMKIDVASLVKEYYAARNLHETEVVSFDGDGAVKATPRELLAMDVHTSSVRIDEVAVVLTEVETSKLESAVETVISSLDVSEISPEDMHDIKVALEGMYSRTEEHLRESAIELRDLATRESIPADTAAALIQAAATSEEVAGIVAVRVATYNAYSELSLCSRAISALGKDISLSDFMKSRLSSAAAMFAAAVGDEVVLMGTLEFTAEEIARLHECVELIREDVNRLI